MTKVKFRALAMTRAHFRYINMECCCVMLCWVNPRLPMHCPECGRPVYPQVKSWVTYSDENAYIRHRDDDDFAGVGWEQKE